MKLKLYNTLTQKKEEFVPLEEGKVKLYVCGPTVYDLLHVGNFRGPVFYNMLRNWLEKLGYHVTYVYNFTDVDDKIIKRAKEEGVSSSEVSERFIKEFQKDYASLGLRAHSFNPRVTDHMQDIIKMIQNIIDAKNAYEVEGEVFYSIENFKDYGKLSHKNVDDIMAGSRIEIDPRKKNPLDFVLWKNAKEGEPAWDSPWGKGRPGWHIECSAMNCSILGEQIDIHGGGMDLIFPHHENEIAQSEAANKKPFVKYWVHNNMIQVSGEKMSKSLGNIIKTREFLEEYDAEIFKFVMLSAHYRSLVDLSESQVSHAISGLARIYSALSLADDILEKAADTTEQNDANFLKVIEDAEEKIKEAMNDDFNSPQAFAAIFDVIRAFNSTYQRGKKIKGTHLFNAKKVKEWISSLSEIYSLFGQKPEGYLKSLDDRLLEEKEIKREDIDQLIEKRNLARKEKDFKTADDLRDKIDKLGIAVLDTPEGTLWEVQK